MSNLQNIRKEKGLSQSKLAEISGVPKVMIQKYERNIRSINNANVCTVLKLAQALEVDARDILEKEN